MHRFVPIAAVLAAFLIGCNEDPPVTTDDIPPGEETGSLVVSLRSSDDAGTIDPAVDEVWVRIESVLVKHDEEGWVDLATDRLDVNLLGPSTTIGEGEVFVGGYDKLQILIADTWIVVDGVEQELAFVGDVDPLDPFASGLLVSDRFFVDDTTSTAVKVEWSLTENLTGADQDWALGAATTTEIDLAGD